MNEQIAEKVKTIIRNALQKQQVELLADTSSKDIEGWDSLRHLMIISEVEKEFGISIDFMEILEIKTVGDICKVVANQTK